MCLHVCVCVHVCVCLCVYVSPYVCVCVLLWVYECMYICVSVRVCLCVCRPSEHLWSGSPITCSSPQEPDSEKLGAQRTSRLGTGDTRAAGQRRKCQGGKVRSEKVPVVLRCKTGLTGTGTPTPSSGGSSLCHCWEPGTALPGPERLPEVEFQHFSTSA